MYKYVCRRVSRKLIDDAYTTKGGSATHLVFAFKVHE